MAKTNKKKKLRKIDIIVRIIAIITLVVVVGSLLFSLLPLIHYYK